MPSPLPRWNHRLPFALFTCDGGLPRISGGSASTSVFSRPAQRSLTLRPACSPSPLQTLYTGGFSRFVASTTAPIATGWSDSCRTGFAPAERQRLCTAHGYISRMISAGSRLTLSSQNSSRSAKSINDLVSSRKTFCATPTRRQRHFIIFLTKRSCH